MGAVPWTVIRNQSRLKSLSSLSIIDTKPEQVYDDLANLARLICNTPVANVCFVTEDRQWFKAFVGNEVQETPVTQSVCAHAISEDSILVINDLRNDSRTNFNTLVTGDSHLRFYAGVPLRLDDGFGGGTLCVLDTKPHPDGLSLAQIEALKALGRQATSQLQTRRILMGRSEEVMERLSSGDPLEDITNSFIKAYNINKSYKDEVLNRLISGGLIHIAKHISERNVKRSDVFH